VNEWDRNQAWKAGRNAHNVPDLHFEMSKLLETSWLCAKEDTDRTSPSNS